MDRFGPALRALALAAAVFALVAIIAPRLGIIGSADPVEPAENAAVSGTDARLDQVPDTSGVGDTTTTTEAPATTTTTVPATTTTVAATTTTTTTTIPPDGAEIRLAVELITGDTDGESPVLVEGDPITWRIIVTNTGDEFLWGAYTFLELHGPAPCDSHRLAPGEATDCWIETVAVEGLHEAEIWATAWTETRMITESVLHQFRVVLSG